MLDFAILGFNLNFITLSSTFFFFYLFGPPDLNFLFFPALKFPLPPFFPPLPFLLAKKNDLEFGFGLLSEKFPCCCPFCFLFCLCGDLLSLGFSPFDWLSCFPFFLPSDFLGESVCSSSPPDSELFSSDDPCVSMTTIKEDLFLFVYNVRNKSKRSSSWNGYRNLFLYS